MNSLKIFYSPDFSPIVLLMEDITDVFLIGYIKMLYCLEYFENELILKSERETEVFNEIIKAGLDKKQTYKISA